MLRTIQLYEQLSYFEASADLAGELADLHAYLQQTKQNLDGQISDLVNRLYAQIISEKLPNKTGFFTGIHKWWKNLWGRNDKENPYYWQNRIGALGRTDIDPATVEEFRMLKNLAQSLSEAVGGADQTLISKILVKWRDQLRSTIGSYMDGMIDRVGKLVGRPAEKAVEPTKSKKADPAIDPAIKPEEPTARRKDAPASAPMADVDAADAVDDTTPVPTAPVPASKPAPAKTSLDDEAAKYDINPATKTSFGVWSKLTDDMKQVVIDACKSSGPECPHKDDDILANVSKLDVLRIVDKHGDKSIEKIKSGAEPIDDHERNVIMAVHEPWLSLGPRERKYHNDQGSGGVPLKSHNRRINGRVYPFRIPPVLRKEDPRFDILQDYYPKLFEKLYNIGRTERKGDTPESIAKRIKHNIRDGKVSGEFEAEDREEATPAPVPEKSPMPGEAEAEAENKDPLIKARMGGLPHDEKVDPIEDVTRDFPDEIKGPIVKLAETDEKLAREVAQAWEKVSKGTKKRDKKHFKDYLSRKEFEEAIGLTREGDADDDIKGMVSNYQPKGPTLLEALKTRLRYQREGWAERWIPMPKKLTPKTLIERLRQQSGRIYQES